MPTTAAPERQRVFNDEWAVRYGVLMGGTETIDTPGIGQYWIGHSQIHRRKLMGFTRQQVRGRNEAEDSAALDAPGGALLQASPLESAKLMDKSPAVCMREAIVMMGHKGFFNSQALMGDEINADRIFNAILPETVQVKPLVDVIDYLQVLEVEKMTFLPDALKSQAERFRMESLQGGYVAREFLSGYCNSITDEVEQKKSKYRIDDVVKSYFWELKRTLPQDKPAEATRELGMSIAGAMAPQTSEREMLAMEEANRLHAEELELRRQELAIKQSSAVDGSTKPSTNKGGK